MSTTMPCVAAMVAGRVRAHAAVVPAAAADSMQGVQHARGCVASSSNRSNDPGLQSP
ncbi:hypothetical protein [Cognatiluteimonas telluris]|uniref:hypothetical protein n=1 Tax=Cognatiluteimonas telluris TaxID=1104775 RepID=UPI00140CB85C|nr:hypothetical protein [Lysobacter telluris]